VSATKIRLIPLAFEPSRDAQGFERSYPVTFTAARPLRVLFLGQITLRKGARQLLDAALLLNKEPVEFWFVGPRQIPVPADLQGHPRLKWFGAISRGNVDRFYRDADVFILPTLSDGFGLTQLEAQSWKLPVIASRFCGAVVEHGRNGIVLEEVSGEAIAAAIDDLLRAPARLVELSRHSYVRDEFSLQALASSLSQLDQ
jgi:glycosyltransferase involved in cell wall biosynthesis